MSENFSNCSLSLAMENIVSLESLLFKNRVRPRFNRDLSKEFDIIKPYLPAKTNAVLDIGCGVAGVDVLISKHYGNNTNIDFCLLDKTGVDRRVHYGFKSKGSFYNSLLVAGNLLLQNGIDSKNIFSQEVDTDYHISFSKQFDLIISLLSWGYHYPVSTYLEEVFELLNRGGRVIIDIRKGTNGCVEIGNKFANTERIIEGAKNIRICASKR
jgi:SAM-dependent methyltransferase